MRRTCVWVSAFRKSVIHRILSEFLGMSEWQASPRTRSWFSFLFVFGILVGLFNNTSDVSEGYGSLRTCLSTLSLDTIAGGWSEWSSPLKMSWVDELEEDLGWSISCLKGVMGGGVGKFEEELVDKPGTTTSTKFSVLHCIRIPFFFKMLFLTVDPLMWVSMFIATLSQR